MEKTILIPYSTSELEAIITNCVLSCIGKTSPGEKVEADLLTIDEACEFVKLSKGKIYSLVSAKEIPYSKRIHSKRLWFSKKELTKWLLDDGKSTGTFVKSKATA